MRARRSMALSGGRPRVERFERTSFAGAGLIFGASLTLPEGPLGRAKIASSAPLVIARLRWDRLTAEVASRPYFSLTNYGNVGWARFNLATLITYLLDGGPRHAGAGLLFVGNDALLKQE